MSPRTLSLPLLTLSTLPAQAVVLPPAAALSAPAIPALALPTVYGASGRTATAPTHAISDAAAIPVPAANWVMLSVRGAAIAAGANAACTVQLKLSLSLSAQPHWNASPTFAANHGPLLTTVFNGPLALPARAAPPAWPAVWEPIPFASQFLYVAALGRALVVDFEQTGNSGSASWALEATSVNQPGVTGNAPNPSACKKANGGTINGWAGSGTAPGSSW